MNWDKWNNYRSEVKQWRIIRENQADYLAILALGIREEFDEFIIERKAGCVEKQVEEYGDLLFNIAEMWNVLEESFQHHRENSYKTDFAPSRCVEVVRKYHMRDRNSFRFIAECWSIAEKCMIDYVCTITAEEAMRVSIAKMKERHG